MKINFHIHSSQSDGAFAPKDVIKIMYKNGFSVVAMTDHDTVAGICEAEEICKENNIKFISGVEITTYVPNLLGILDDSYKLHMLGLGIDGIRIEKFLNKHEFMKIQYHTNILMDLGFDETEIKEKCQLDNRVSCASFIVKKGKIDTVDKALSLFRTSPYAPSIEETIQEIHYSGGIAIWAHPFLLPRNGGFRIDKDQFLTIYKYMKPLGLDGLEGYYLQFPEADQDFIESICKVDNLFCSTGTDFHGDYPWEYELLSQEGRTDANLVSALNQ